MIGSDSIGHLSRATGDEQLLKSQRVSDKKRKQEDKQRRKDKRDSDADAQEQEFEAVIVDIELPNNTPGPGATNNVGPGNVPGSATTRAQSRTTGRSNTDQAHEDEESQNHSEGHIDVTG